MSIKARDFEDAQSIINCIQQGRATRRDLVALLMYLREDLPNNLIKDLAHCVAHSSRDRGYAYSHIMHVTVNFLELWLPGKDSVKQGRELFIEPVFPIDEVIMNMAADLQAIGFNVVPLKLQSNAELIEALLRNILAGTMVALDRKVVRSCRFEEITLNEVTKLRFVIQFQNGIGSRGGIMDILSRFQWSFPVFKADSTIIVNSV